MFWPVTIPIKHWEQMGKKKKRSADGEQKEVKERSEGESVARREPIRRQLFLSR